MNEVLQIIESVLENPYKQLNSWKQDSKRKIIGCLPMYTPEEIIHAAGMLPMTLFGSIKHGNLADRHLLPFTCRGLRSSYDMLLKGEYENLDGVVIPLICDQMRFTSDFWDMARPFFFFHQIGFSFRIDSAGKNFFIRELTRLKMHLEEFVGKYISVEALRKSILIYNENRRLLRKISELRKARQGLVRADDMVKLITSSMMMQKEEHNRLLNDFLIKAEQSLPKLNGKIKLVLVGHPCYPPEGRILDVIEELGGIIVEDDLFIGRRYFDADVHLNGDPIESLAGHFIDGMPCPIKHNPGHFMNIDRTTPDYADIVIKMFKESGADGVINLGEMYCDPYDFEFPYLKQRLEKEKIPFFAIRNGAETTSLEPIRTRMEGFLEMLRK